jgi:hypothetical protein
MPTVDERYQAKLLARARGTTEVTVHPPSIESLTHPQDRYQAKLVAHQKRLDAGGGQSADNPVLDEIIQVATALEMDSGHIAELREHLATLSAEELQEQLVMAKRDLRRKQKDAEAKAKAESDAAKEAEKKAAADAKAAEAKAKAEAEAKAKAESDAKKS